MKIDDNKKVESFLQMQLFTQALKSTLGEDSIAFSAILESLSNSIIDKNGINNGSFGEIDLKNLGYGGGQKLVSELKSTFNNVKSDSKELNKLIEQVSKKFCIDKDLVMAVIKQESDFDSNSTSTAGAMGLMQLMPETASYLGVKNPYNIEDNVNGGTKYLKGLLDMYGNCKELALAAYNAGPGTLQRRGVKNVSDINKLPYETRDYVKKVMKYYGK
ncbi:soluble lytic murein transglycosylase-like protein [Clostridium tetanomorphum]|uniref:Lytic transglycosylase domain-containing protein n=1 Tax=Clostridium tetanomorphum TaxID=1553 RepID=A0A923ED56_CLOTT|nr:lytic transglycosylase domain-containing protein [Clostridium tetanomorphum]KAJ52897.1 soluble lytic murein transglycosylase [Clostridium tetanomorphum DSM 665]MBC2399892.1 lytic transglycosylase domain-containing protein [Clostridium tetanomorphum]MBP1865964.1 soluble lytic murein transglycosylase-like protein [Clostridium tetanomorphum]NRS85982.1 soluble lytic murein transglycosylase-like protein [Clostridium tetanomorphum]NRZ96008.1 soluble lytic murein transglycosylase-like protein [Clo